MTTTQESNTSKIRDFFFGALHSVIIPICLAQFLGWYGLFYLFIPAAAYATIAFDQESKYWFCIFTVFVLCIVVGSWSDVPVQGY